MFQGHSVESILPALPENGSTVKTTVLELDPKGLDDSPVPSATSREEEHAETTEAAEEEPNPAAAAKKTRRKKLRLAHSSSSSPAKDPELKDDATSNSPPHMQASPLKAYPLSSVPPPPTAGGIIFGGPGGIPSLSDDDDMYVFVCHQLVLSFLHDFLALFLVQRCGRSSEPSKGAHCLSPSSSLSSCYRRTTVAKGSPDCRHCFPGEGSGDI